MSRGHFPDAVTRWDTVRHNAVFSYFAAPVAGTIFDIRHSYDRSSFVVIAGIASVPGTANLPVLQQCGEYTGNSHLLRYYA